MDTVVDRESGFAISNDVNFAVKHVKLPDLSKTKHTFFIFTLAKNNWITEWWWSVHLSYIEAYKIALESVANVAFIAVQERFQNWSKLGEQL